VSDLRELRRMAGWTQQKAARAAKLNRAKLSQAECQEIDLTPAEDAAVRRVLLAAICERTARMQGLLTQASA
jgi:transcriptional regulator with XRE-family HTH domain